MNPIRKILIATMAFALASVLAASDAAPVVVIHGDRSLANDKERAFALPLARHAVKWFRDGGITADISDDKDMASALAGRKVAMLVHCANPDSIQLSAVRDFVRDGGKLIVTFSSSTGLAGIMGVVNGEYRTASEGAFSTMRFSADRPPNIPSEIRQSSSRIMMDRPVHGRARTLAWWCDRDGNATEYSAWIASDAGYWMTHVLLGDGDAKDKGQLLVALAASLAPELWEPAAEARLSTAVAVGPWDGPEDAIRKTADLRDTPRIHRMRLLLKQAVERFEVAHGKLKNGRAVVAWMMAGEIEREMQEAYGLMQTPRKGEIRAVWDCSGQGLFPGDWTRTCSALKKAGVTDILVKVAGPGFANCAIDAFPRLSSFDPGNDQLKACIEAAKPLGIRVHAWLVCLSADQSTASRMEYYQRNGWLLQGTDGAVKAWLDPSSVAVRAQVVRAAQELLTRYDVAGVHLDFIRYPDYYGSLGEGTRIRFEADRGAVVTGWPNSVRYGALFSELVRWRARQVTALLAEVRAMQRRVAPGREISVAVLGKYPTCIESVGQDWMSWLECGYVDYVYPMNYTENGRRYAELLATQLERRNVAAHIVGGIGVTAAESRLDADGVIRQIDALRNGGAAGFALYDLDPHLMNDVLPVLNLGMTSREK